MINKLWDTQTIQRTRKHRQIRSRSHKQINNFDMNKQSIAKHQTTTNDLSLKEQQQIHQTTHNKHPAIEADTIVAHVIVADATEADADLCKRKKTNTRTNKQ